MSGVSSQPKDGNSWGSDTTGRAGELLAAGIASLEAQASADLDEVWKEVFGKDVKKWRSGVSKNSNDISGTTCITIA